MWCCALSDEKRARRGAATAARLRRRPRPRRARDQAESLHITQLSPLAASASCGQTWARPPRHPFAAAAAARRAPRRPRRSSAAHACSWACHLHPCLPRRRLGSQAWRVWCFGGREENVDHLRLCAQRHAELQQPLLQAHCRAKAGSNAVECVSEADRTHALHTPKNTG